MTPSSQSRPPLPQSSPPRKSPWALYWGLIWGGSLLCAGAPPWASADSAPSSSLESTQARFPASSEIELPSSAREDSLTSELLLPESGTETRRLSFDYYGLFFGPSPGNWSSFQTRPNGELNLDRPVLMKNWASLSTSALKDWEISAAAYWIWVPVQGQDFWLRDPYLRLARPQILTSDSPVQLYADLRWHPGISSFSRERDQLFGLQLFSMFHYPIPTSGWSLGLLGSARKNFFGPEPQGLSWEFYLAPQARYAFDDRLSFQLLYEMNAAQDSQDPTGTMVSDGTDLEPSLLWQISPRVSLNPFLTLYVGEGLKPRNTALGMGVSWSLY